MQPSGEAQLVGVGKKREKSCSLHSIRQHTLVFRRSSGDPARKNFPSIRDKLAEKSEIFIVDHVDLVGRKITDFSSGSTAASSFVIHNCWAILLVITVPSWGTMRTDSCTPIHRPLSSHVAGRIPKRSGSSSRMRSARTSSILCSASTS